MELIPYAFTAADLELTRALETDPEVMRELGGPVADSEIDAIHRRRAAGVATGDWWLKIVLAEGEAVGTIGIWPRDPEAPAEYEMGWMVLPEFQGRGIASKALALILKRAEEELVIAQVHAFPGMTNAASNALCRRHGFELIAEDVEGAYAGHELRCNHWLLRL